MTTGDDVTASTATAETSKVRRCGGDFPILQDLQFKLWNKGGHWTLLWVRPTGIW